MCCSHSTRWKSTWGKSLSVMATLPTTLYMRTWWRISLPKRMRTKTASYPPESLLTSTMNFKVSLVPQLTHWLTHSLPVRGGNTLEFIAKTLSGYQFCFRSFTEALSLCGVRHVNSSCVKICVVGFEPTVFLNLITSVMFCFGRSLHVCVFYFHRNLENLPWHIYI